MQQTFSVLALALAVPPPAIEPIAADGVGPGRMGRNLPRFFLETPDGASPADPCSPCLGAP